MQHGMNGTGPAMAYRSSHFDINLTTTSRNVTLHVLHLKDISFEMARP